MASQSEEASGVQIEPYCWTVHPARQRLGAALAAALAIGCFAVLCGVVADPWLGLLSVIVLAGSLNRFFLRSRFTVDSHSIRADYPLRSQKLDWRDVRRFKRDRFGGFLSTRSRASRLDGYRGMHLLFGDSRDEDIRQIETQMAGESVVGSGHSDRGTSWAG